MPVEFSNIQLILCCAGAIQVHFRRSFFFLARSSHRRERPAKPWGIPVVGRGLGALSSILTANTQLLDS